jgi:hypothetical protein
MQPAMQVEGAPRLVERGLSPFVGLLALGSLLVVAGLGIGAIVLLFRTLMG